MALGAAMMVMASSTVAGPAAGATAVVGSDISFPQCGQAYPARPAFAILGVNNGRPDTANPCLASEYRWASGSGIVEFYMNTANPGLTGAEAYRYGVQAARYAYSYATSQVSAGPGHRWWLDVETGNSWSDDQGANTAVITGAMAFLRGQGVPVGIYSTRYQWNLITGAARLPSVPNWVPGAESGADAPSFCSPQRSFTGGPVVMTQYTTRYDYDFLCPGTSGPGTGNILDAILSWLNSL